ncbi:hypothetical protein ACFVYV_43380 [Streptomyces mirabilis]|uniref:hypothetical protein n=1 Tax=Streptomyces mirabilis TaxID=68239 RepID=UPI0036D9F138
MTEQPVGPRCGNNPNIQLADGDRKAVDDFKARLALKEAAKPYIDRAVWVDGDLLMEVVAATVWERCARDDENTPQLVCYDPRTIAAFAAAVARAHAATQSAPADQTTPLSSFVLWLDASDGSVPTHDDIVWPDGTATVHHRHFGYTTTHPDPETARQSAHGNQGRIVWPATSPPTGPRSTARSPTASPPTLSRARRKASPGSTAGPPRGRSASGPTRRSSPRRRPGAASAGIAPAWGEGAAAAWS